MQMIGSLSGGKKISSPVSAGLTVNFILGVVFGFCFIVTFTVSLLLTFTVTVSSTGYSSRPTFPTVAS
jgi:hypothetical protein